LRRKFLLKTAHPTACFLNLIDSEAPLYDAGKQMLFKHSFRASGSFLWQDKRWRSSAWRNDAPPLLQPWLLLSHHMAPR